MTHLQKIAFVGIFLFALFIRFYDLGGTPSGFHQDEVANAYVGRFILENGVDLYGNKWPLLYFDKHGDYPPVIPMYFSGLGTYVFGVNEFGARAAGAALGTLSLVAIFFLSYFSFRNFWVAIATMGALSLTPWHVNFSRNGTEGMMGLSVYLFGVALLLFAYRSKKYLPLIFSFILLFSTYLLYPSFRIIIPPVLIAATFLFQKGSLRKLVILGAVASVALTLVVSQTNWGKGRYEQTAIMSKTRVAQDLEPYIYNDKSILMARIFNNKVVHFSHEFTKQYLSYFSPDFLLTQESQPPWFKVPRVGLLPLAFVIPLLALAYLIWKGQFPNVDKKIAVFLAALFFVGPLASSFTNEFTPNVHRAIPMLAGIAGILALGFLAMSQLKGKIRLIVVSLFIMVFFMEASWFGYNYSKNISAFTAILRQDENRQLVKYAGEHEKEYSKVYLPVSGWMSMYYLFFTKNFDKNLSGKFAQNFSIDHIGKVYFLSNDCPRGKDTPQEENTMIIVNKGCTLDLPFKPIQLIGTTTNIDVYSVYTNKGN